MSLVDTITKVQAKGNDIKRRLLMSPGQRCIYLKAAGETERFSVTYESISGHNLRWSDFRNSFVLEQAYVEANPTAPVFRDILHKSSHIAYGAPMFSGVNPTPTFGYIDLYIMDPEQIDVKPPTVDSPFWKVLLTRLGSKRYFLTN